MTAVGDSALRIAAGAASGFAWLDGGDSGRGWLGSWPDLTIEGDDLALLDEVNALWREDPSRVWVGWLTYDLGAAEILGRPAPSLAIRGLCLRRYAGALEIERERVTSHGDPAACERLRRGSGPAVESRWLLDRLRPGLAEEDYRTRVRRAREHVVAGDTYQVNLSQPFSAAWTSSEAPLAMRVAQAYGALRLGAPATMGALIDAGGAWIISNSPETLLDVRAMGGEAVARSWPIKGTRPRGDSRESDAQAREELLGSAKDAAEHVMIVDLVRNDLGRVAVPGTVTAPAKPELVALPTVLHLVSEVRCVLRPGWSLRSVLAAVFPGGSVTGAPKRRTTEIISELEDGPRGIYCGAIVVLEPGGLRCSIPIRTGMLDERGLQLRSGGGVVVDSDPEAERLETEVKARAFNPIR